MVFWPCTGEFVMIIGHLVSGCALIVSLMMILGYYVIDTIFQPKLLPGLGNLFM
jgi:hypothetical protein